MKVDVGKSGLVIVEMNSLADHVFPEFVDQGLDSSLFLYLTKEKAEELQSKICQAILDLEFRELGRNG